MSATQVERPWRTTVRTVFQCAIGIMALLPLLVDGRTATAPVVVAALTVSATVTRLMALPQVEDFLERFVPWLAAEK